MRYPSNLQNPFPGCFDRPLVAGALSIAICGLFSRLQTRFPNEINQILEPSRLGRAFTELRCTFAGRSLLPAIPVFEWERIPLNESGDVENQFLAKKNQPKLVKKILRCSLKWRNPICAFPNLQRVEGLLIPCGTYCNKRHKLFHKNLLLKSMTL